MFSSSTLGALTSAQEDAGDWRQQMDTDLANQMVGQLDSDGDGSLSLSEIENALGASGGSTGATDAADTSDSSSSTSATDSLSAAFAQLDANGDGQLSSDELSKALGQAPAAHGHHHHHGPPPDALSGDDSSSKGSSASTTGADSTSTGTSTTSTASSDSTASDSTSSGGAPSGEDLINAALAQAVQAFMAQIQQQASSLQSMLQPSSATSVTA